MAVDVRLDSDSTDDRGRAPLFRAEDEPRSLVREVMGRTICDSDERTELMVSARDRDVLGVDDAEKPKVDTSKSDALWRREDGAVCTSAGSVAAGTVWSYGMALRPWLNRKVCLWLWMLRVWR